MDLSILRLLYACFMIDELNYLDPMMFCTFMKECTISVTLGTLLSFVWIVEGCIIQVATAKTLFWEKDVSNLWVPILSLSLTNVKKWGEGAEPFAFILSGVALLAGWPLIPYWKYCFLMIFFKNFIGNPHIAITLYHSSSQLRLW